MHSDQYMYMWVWPHPQIIVYYSSAVKMVQS